MINVQAHLGFCYFRFKANGFTVCFPSEITRFSEKKKELWFLHHIYVVCVNLLLKYGSTIAHWSTNEFPTAWRQSEFLVCRHNFRLFVPLTVRVCMCVCVCACQILLHLMLSVTWRMYICNVHAEGLIGFNELTSFLLRY